MTSIHVVGGPVRTTVRGRMFGSHRGTTGGFMVIMIEYHKFRTDWITLGTTIRDGIAGSRCRWGARPI